VAALLLAAGSVAAESQAELVRQMSSGLSLAFVLRLWLGMSLIGTIHEFGHGLTCKQFGGRSNGIGLLWMYGIPCFYCDVTGAWMLPHKRQRLWVSAGGLYYQFIAGALARAAAAREAARLVVATSSPAHLETSHQRARSATIALTAARTARPELLPSRTEILMKRQDAQRLEAQIAIIQDQLRRTALIAPCDGVVTTLRASEKVGASFGQGATILEIEDPSSLFTRIFVNEKELGDVRVGQWVDLRVAAFPDRLYRGRLSEIAPRAVATGTEAFPANTVEVRLRVDNPTGELRSGMSGWAKIHCGHRPLGSLLMRRVARYFRTEVWSWF
jgi:hypothetical protein